MKQPIAITLLSLFLICFNHIHASQKVLLMTFVHSRPDFIELHAKTLKAFLKDDYEYVVFNDAPNAQMSLQMEQTCAKLGIRCFRVPAHNADRQAPGARHIDGIHFALNTIGLTHDGIVVIIDADMFLVKPLSIIEYMKDYDIVAPIQHRSNQSTVVTYIAPDLVLMNMQNLPNKHTIDFNGGHIEGMACDNGGQFHHYFKNNPTLKLKLFTALSTDNIPSEKDALAALGYDDNAINFIFKLRENKAGMEFHADNNFVHHYAGGCNWVGYAAQYMQIKARVLNEFINANIAKYAQT